MPTPSNPNLIAQAAGTGVDPRLRKKLGELLVQQTDTAAAVPASGIPEPVNVLQGPAAAPARTPNGNMGRTLLEDPQAPASSRPTTQKVKGFEETAGGKMAMSLLEKRKNLKWWMPDQFADRNERDMAQAIDLARVEMGQTVAQSAANREERRLVSDSASSTPSGRDRYKAVGGALFDTETRAWEQPPEQRDIGTGRRYINSGQGLYDSETKTWVTPPPERSSGRGQKSAAATPAAKPLYDVGASDPGATGVFANYAAKLLKDNPMIDVQDVPAEQVKASRLGILPKMMSTPADRPVSAGGPTGGPAPGAVLNRRTFERDPRTGKLVEVR